MKTFFQKIKSLMPSRRRIIQLYCAVLFNVNFKGFVTGNIYKGDSKQLCVPGINCYSCPGAVGACPLGSLQGSFSADRSTLYYMVGTLVLYGLLFGRMICGWFCPFGLIQELLYKIKTPKLKKGRITRILSYFKYVVLVFFVFIVPVMYAFRDTPLPAFCKYICPAGTLEGGIGLLANKVNASYFSMLGPLFTWKFLLMVSILVACIFIFRMFCRFICPLGALYGFFNRFSFFGVKVEKSKCTNCNLCVSHCKMDVKQVGDHECISCGECVKVCPTKAITWKGPQALINHFDTENAEKQKKTRFVTRLISLVLLLGILIYAIISFWNDESNKPAKTPASNGSTDVEVGTDIGDMCYGDNLQIITKEGLQADTINPVETGKVTVINFWGTWCSGCVKELPYFDQIAAEYKDKVTVIAVHTDMMQDTAPAYITEHYPSSDIVFAKDTAGEGYYTALGGRGAYPITIIIDEEGIIHYSVLTALTYDDLKEMVEDTLNN